MLPRDTTVVHGNGLTFPYRVMQAQEPAFWHSRPRTAFQTVVTGSGARGHHCCSAQSPEVPQNMANFELSSWHFNFLCFFFFLSNMQLS